MHSFLSFFTSLLLISFIFSKSLCAVGGVTRGTTTTTVHGLAETELFPERRLHGQNSDQNTRALRLFHQKDDNSDVRTDSGLLVETSLPFSLQFDTIVATESSSSNNHPQISNKATFNSLLSTHETCSSETFLPQGATCLPNIQTCHPKYICDPTTKTCSSRKNLSKLHSECMYHYECGYGKRCVGRKCQLGRLHGEVCVSDHECYFGRCNSQGTCEDRSIGALCSTSMHNQCGMGLYCENENNSCRTRKENGEKCRTHRECHVNGYCLKQECRQLPSTEGQICVTQCDPINNLECVNGLCTKQEEHPTTKCAGILSPSGECQQDVPCSSNNATMCDDFCNCDKCTVREETRIMEKYGKSLNTYFVEAKICASKKCFGWGNRDMTRQELEAWMVNPDGCVFKNCGGDFFNGNSPYCHIADEMGGNPQDYMDDGYLIPSDEDSLCRNYTNLGFLVVIIIGFCLFICIFFLGSFLVMLMAARHIRRQEALELESEVEMSMSQTLINVQPHTNSSPHTFRVSGNPLKPDDEFVSVFSHDHVVPLNDFPMSKHTESRMPHFANIRHNIAWDEEHSVGHRLGVPEE